MKIYDVSWPVSEGMVVYKNKPEKRPRFEMVRSFEKGSSVQETVLHLEAHCGTHVESALHVVKGGGGVDKIPLEHFVGSCKVLDLTAVPDAITAEVLKRFEIKPQSRILFKTKNSYDSSSEFNLSFVYLEKSGAAFLAALQPLLVGIDYLGLERDQPGHDSHKALLKKGTVVVEGLRLGDVPAGDYFLVCAPLRIPGVEASPARVWLIPESDSWSPGNGFIKNLDF